MARIEDIERRLNNWARWKPRGQSGGLGFSSCDMTSERVDGGEGHGAVFQDGEEAITDLAVESLEHALQTTVFVAYVEGGGRERKLKRLGGITAATFNARIWEAHRKLAAWFTDRRQLADQERDRVEKLQRVAAR